MVAHLCPMEKPPDILSDMSSILWGCPVPAQAIQFPLPWSRRVDRGALQGFLSALWFGRDGKQLWCWLLQPVPSPVPLAPHPSMLGPVLTADTAHAALGR